MVVVFGEESGSDWGPKVIFEVSRAGVGSKRVASTDFSFNKRA